MKEKKVKKMTSEKKELKKEELKRVVGGTKQGTQVIINR